MQKQARTGAFLTKDENTNLIVSNHGKAKVGERNRLTSFVISLTLENKATKNSA
jgi:hypothetical protein